MQLGMIGLGRMGANIVRRLMRDGHECVVYDRSADSIKALESDGAIGASSLADFASKLTVPRAAWVMIPAGATGETVNDLSEVFESGDIIIDGGNSNYRDDVDRAAALKTKGIHYVDVGTSGGVWGIERGLLPDDRRRDRGGRPPRPVVREHRPGTGRGCAHARAHRRAEPRRAGLPALRPERRGPLRQDGAQRHRVRPDGRLRRGAQRPRPRRRRPEGRRALGRGGADRAAAVLPVRPRHREGHRGVAARFGDRVLAARPDGRRAGRPTRTWTAWPGACPTRAKGAGR